MHNFAPSSDEQDKKERCNWDSARMITACSLISCLWPIFAVPVTIILAFFALHSFMPAAIFVSLLTATMQLCCYRYMKYCRKYAACWEKRAMYYWQLAFKDPLTGLGNLAAFQQASEQNNKKADQPLCLILIDLDDLKKTNDGYGHAAGDQLLCQMAEHLCHQTADRGSAFRIGGDEFAILLPGCDKATAQAVLQQLRTAAAEIHFSCGLAYRKQYATQSVTQLQQIADAALYQEKKFKNHLRQGA